MDSMVSTGIREGGTLMRKDGAILPRSGSMIYSGDSLDQISIIRKAPWSWENTSRMDFISLEIPDLYLGEADVTK
jgi:hypothetical protein